MQYSFMLYLYIYARRYNSLIFYKSWYFLSWFLTTIGISGRGIPLDGKFIL